MIIAENVVPGWDTDAMAWGIGGASRQDIVNTGGNGACGNILVAYTVAALRRSDSPSQGLDACL